MRYKGKILEWQDDRGFGFIAPMAGGDRVFVHIKAFKRRSRRPVGGEVVTYELGRDLEGRQRALNVAYSRAALGHTLERRSWSMIFAATFVALVAAAVVDGRLPTLILIAYLAVSAVTFSIYAWDKSAARNDRWRTRESTLHTLGLLGGWPGAVWAHRLLRHKSRKRSFQVTFWVTVLLNCGALVWILGHPDGVRDMQAALERMIRSWS